jgi:hypothetical protein
VQALKDAADAQLENDSLTAKEREAIKEKLDADLVAMENQKNIALENEEKQARGAAREATIASRALSTAQALINTYFSATAAFANVVGTAGPIAAGIAAAAAVAAGLASVAQINATPIPSAETGGRFVVPGSSAGGVDNQLMRVNPGEQVSVTPRGQTGGGDMVHVVINLDGQAFVDVINKRLRSGDIFEMSPSWNLASGAA